MTTAELTAELNTLTTAEQERVGVFIANLKKHRKDHPAVKGYTKKELISAIKRSHRQAKQGKVRDARSFLAEMQEKYGLST